MNEMTKTELTDPRGKGPSSEATLVEQQRAVAQVQGALVVAQQRPRDVIAARTRMEETCSLKALADHAFFRYSRGGSQISGPSIHLATELARCWGNIDYGISELRRDDHKGESEMLSYAWDLETNARVVNSFIVPHKRDKRGGPEPLIDMRDVYENNANQAARRLRECIFRVLPKSYVEEAKTLCMDTLEKGDGEPIEKRREKMLEAFVGMGVSRKQIEDKIGHKADRLTAYDLGVLRVIYQSLRRGEVTVGDEFPADEGAEVAQRLKGGAQESPAEKESPQAAPDQTEQDTGGASPPKPPVEGAGSKPDPAPAPSSSAKTWTFVSPRADEPAPCGSAREWADRMLSYMGHYPAECGKLIQMNADAWQAVDIEYPDIMRELSEAVDAAKAAGSEAGDGGEEQQESLV